MNVRNTEPTTKDDTKLPCRIVCSVEGLEWFMYNNTPVYENMKELLGLESVTTTEESNLSFTKNLESQTVHDPEIQTTKRSLFERLMPIQLECINGAVIIGNTTLPTFIVGKATQFSGTYSTGKSRSPMDYYKSSLDLVFRKPLFTMEPNEKYRDQIDNNIDILRHQRTWWKSLKRWILWLMCLSSDNYTENLHSEQQNKHRTGETNSQNLYQDDYAKIENIFECKQMTISYYTDYAGPVPNTIANEYSGVGDNIGNGGLPPEWGVRMSTWDAVIHYGPWADKQRATLQDYFFPNAHRTNKPTKPLLPGDTRMATSFDFILNFMTDATIRVPTREPSKDWKYTGQMLDLDVDKDGFYARPYGWLNIKAKEGSSIKTITPFVLNTDGCNATVDIDLKDVEISTSVNYSNFIQIDSFQMHIDMPSPLIWNDHRNWAFDGKLKNPEIFLLRDHVYLIQDLIKDWTSGPTSDLLHFIPMTYTFEIDMTEPKVYLCVNEHNVINYPNSIDDNAYIILCAQKIYFNTSLPFTTYEPEVNTIRYKAHAEQVRAGISLQTSHTWRSFMSEQDSQIASCVSVSLDGSYEYYSSIDVLRHIESSNLHLKFQGAVVKLFGTVIRYIFILRDNYVGSSLHFSTIDEFRERRADPNSYNSMQKKENDAKPMADPFEVYVLCEIEDGALILPENLYEGTHYSQLEFEELQLELRNLDIYMDMYVTISPITWTRDSNPNTSLKRNNFRMKNARDPRNYLYIDETNIYAHRLFGPLPETATYLCHWEFEVGRITGELKPSFLLGAANFAQTFVYNLIDEDNAISPEMAPAEYPDVTFVKANIREIDIYLMTQNSATQLQLVNGLSAEFDNLINEKYGQRVGIKAPGVSIICLANQDRSKEQQDTDFSWVEVGRVSLGLNCTIFRHTKNWKSLRKAQQNFIQTQDYLTRRCVNLYDSDAISTRSHLTTRTTHEHHVGVLYAPVYRSFQINNNSNSKSSNDNSSVLTETPTEQKYSLSGDGHSMLSFNEQWLGLMDSDDDISVHDETVSMKSVISNNESFHTAYSENLASQTSSPLANLNNSGNFAQSYDNLSFDSKSDGILSEDDDEYSYINEDDNHPEGPGYTISAIPPSIPYSSYLNRFSVKRATASLTRGQSFFHPYIPPPKTTFTPLKTNVSSENDGFVNDKSTGTFFTKDSGEMNSNIFSDFDNNDENDKRNDVVATTVLETTETLKILVTPILVKVVQELTEIINQDDWDLETMLDSSQIEYVEQLTRYLSDKFICTRFAVWLPSTHLHFIQNVMIPADLPSYKFTQSHLETFYNNEEEMLCTADIFLDNFKMIGGVTFQDYAFDEKQKSVAESRLVLEESRVHVDADNMRCKVQYISGSYENRRQVMFGIPTSRQYTSRAKFQHKTNGINADDNDDNNLTNELVVIDLGLNEFSCKWLGARNPNYFELEVNEISTIIIAESVEILLGAVYSWLVFVDDLQRILDCFKDRRCRQNQVFINELARFSNDESAISCDPQFLTIPTTMGLRIGSGNFRNDVGWKLLARMRQCLRLMPLTMREKLQYRLTSGGAIENVNPTLLYNQVMDSFSGWRSWEINNHDVRKCRLFTDIFVQQRVVHMDSDIINNNISKGSNQGKSDQLDELIDFLMTSTNSAKIRINRFDFCIYEEEPESYDNRIIVDPFEFAVDTMYKTSILDNKFGEDYAPEVNRDNKNYSKSTISEGYLDAITKLDIGLIEIAANPTILAFARHMLTVQRVFTNKLQKLSHAAKPSSFGNEPQELYESTTTLNKNQSFDVDQFLSRIDVVAHGFLRIQDIKVGAWAQKLTMKNNINDIYGTIVFSNPRLSPPVTLLQASSEKDSDTGSGKPSSNKTARKQTPQSNRVILNTSGGFGKISMGFYELLPRSVPVGTNNYLSAQYSTLKRISTKLLEIIIQNTKLNANLSQPATRPTKRSKLTTDLNTRKVLNIFSSVGDFAIDAPQSLLRLYSFVEEWGTEQGKRYHFMFQNLLNEWDEQRRLNDSSYSSLDQHTHGSGQSSRHASHKQITSNTTTTAPSDRGYDIKLQFLLVNFVAEADLLRSLSIRYSINDLLLSVNETQIKLAPVITYDFQLSKQTIDLITHATNASTDTKSINTNNTGSFNLPGIRSSGKLLNIMTKSNDIACFKLESSISVDFISMTVDVGMIDSILTAQNLLGNEINEIVEVFSYTKRNIQQANIDTPTLSSPTPSSSPSSTSKEFKYAIGILLEGLSIKAASPSATGLFESNTLEASISNCISTSASQSLIWKVSGNNFALSLDHGGTQLSNITFDQTTEHHGIKRRNRLAYIVIDFCVQNQIYNECANGHQYSSQHVGTTLNKNNNNQQNINNNNEEHQLISYNIHISKIHTVMQPIALGKLADMYIYYDTELKKKKEMKQAEIEQLATNTKRIVESFQTDISLDDRDLHKLWQGKQLSLSIENVGIAIPLSDMHESSPHSYQLNPSSALLFALTSLQFTTKNIKTTTVDVENITLQFVKRFDQSNEDHFLSSNHPRMNQMRLPSIDCAVNTLFDKETKRLGVRFNAKVGEFGLDLDGSIAEYINHLSVIYVKSMDRVNSLTLETGNSMTNNNHKINIDLESAETATSNPQLVYLDIEGTLDYEAGIVRLYPKRQTMDYIRKRTKQSQRSSKNMSVGSDVNNTSNQAENSNMATIKLPGLNVQFKYQTPLGASASTSNLPRQFHGDVLIRESNNILHPSLVQFLHEVVAVLKLGVQSSSERKAKRDTHSITNTGQPSSNTHDINASILLRLSKTKIDLSCHPVSKVICSLGWDESEFIMNSFMDNNARTMSCIGSLRNISTLVKHQFSPQSCFTATMDQMVFNAMLTSKRDDGCVNDDISIIIKIPYITGDLNIRHLQDLLILHKCWFGQPLPRQEKELQQQPLEKEEQQATPFARYVAIQIEKIILSVDMGQAIGKIKLVPENLLIHTHRIPYKSEGIGLSVEGIHLTSEGRLTGEAKLHRILVNGRVDFKIIKGGLKDRCASTCQLFMLSEGGEAKFTYEYQNILDLVQEPIQLTATVDQLTRGSKHQLSASINVGKLLASVSIKTVPVIIVMYRRFMELIDKKRNEANLIDISWITTTNTATTTISANTNSPTHVTSNILTSSPIDIASSDKMKFETSDLQLLLLQHQQQQKQQPYSKVDLTVDGIHIIVYPSQFQDGDNVEVMAIKMKGSLTQEPSFVEKGMKRLLLLSIGKAALLKNVPGQIIMENQRQKLEELITSNEQQRMNKEKDDNDDDDDRNIHNKKEDIKKMDGNENDSAGASNMMKKDNSKEKGQNQNMNQQNDSNNKKQRLSDTVPKYKGTAIFSLPETILNMDTTQIDRHVKHTFRVDFKDWIQASLNIGQMKYLQELVKMYDDQMARAKTTNDAVTTRIPLSSSSTQIQESDLGDESININNNGLGDIQQQTLTATTTNNDNEEINIKDENKGEIEKKTETSNEKALIYTTSSPVHFDPQLKQLGDATPSIDLLGFNRERLPSLIHENITLHLDQIVHAIWKFYQNEVSKS
ncbi:hypothetical protein BJ944DRAFT_238031 [Cunninghamella echinulata]|nr:hypothetical protein BJ944DRAFT_238031 [Cunninghamella echinulata]